MRLGSLATCYLLKGRGMRPIFQIACRHRNRLALQSDLLSAAALGMEDVLAVDGEDPPPGRSSGSQTGVRPHLHRAHLGYTGIAEGP
jgi:5,10-methylenetetrahydrofolate reductase